LTPAADDGVDARAVGQARVDQRLALVDARPTWATIRSMIASVTLSEMNRRPIARSAAALDVDLVRPRP